VPVTRWETALTTGTAAMAASRMQSIRGKQKKRRERKLAFSTAFFHVFIVPV